MSTALLTAAEIDAADLADWRPISNALHTRLRTGNFATGLRLVNRIGEAAEAADHHPDLDLRYPHLNVKLSSHHAGGITDRDVALARQISEIAAGEGVAADPSVVEVFELALDTPGHERIKPFWRAVLGYRDNARADDEVRNDDGALPPLWFQGSGADEPRQRFHIDIRVPNDMVEQRVQAALGAGGRLVYRAESFVTLADADGNNVCVCNGT